MEKKPFLTEAMAQEIIQDVPTPFHVYDEKGIRENARRINKAFSWNKGFKEYFAVKALPNPVILQILQGGGLRRGLLVPDGADAQRGVRLLPAATSCSPPTRLPWRICKKAYELGAYHQSGRCHHGGLSGACRPVCRRTIFCRYNPGGTFSLGESEEGFQVMDKPGDAKYGMTEEQMIDSYKKLDGQGRQELRHPRLPGLQHHLRCLLSRSWHGILFQLAVRVQKATGVHIGYINLSGGVGIPYRPEQTENDIMAIGEGVRRSLRRSWCPPAWAMWPSLPRWAALPPAPYGALVATAIHEKHIYKEYIGLDACAANLMRPAMYGAYHHITVLGKENEPCDHMYDVVGGLCENNDKFAIDRMLPKIDIGDIVYIHDTGAHGSAMGYNYNGKLRSAEVLLCEDGTHRLIRRAETPRDYFATLDFLPLMKPLFED